MLSKKIIVNRELKFRESFIFYFFPLLFSSRFIFAALDSGQVTVMILFSIILGLYFLEKKKNILASAFLALSVMFKYTSIIFLPYFLIRRKIKFSILIILFLIIYCLIPAAYLGISKNTEYIKNWLPFISTNSLDTGTWYDSKNQSLYSSVLRLFGQDSHYNPILKLSFNQCLFLAGLLGLAIYFLILIRPKSQSSHTTDHALLLLCAALFNPNAWLTNFVFFIFAYMVIVYHLLKVRFRDKTILFFTVLSFIFSSWGAESIVGDKLQKLFEAMSTVTIAALLVIFALFRLKFKKLSANI
jgi:hypothetical protein